MPQPIVAEQRWPRGASLIAIGAFGVVAGVALGSAPAAGLGLALVGAPLLVRALLAAALKRTNVTRAAPRSASEGDRVSITLTLENRSAIPLFSARVVEVFGPESLSPRTTTFATRIDRGRASSESAFATCRRTRGIYPHGPMVLELTDPFEWFTVRRAIDVITEFKIYPKLQNPHLPDKVLASLSDADPSRRMIRLSETDEFFSVRDYVPGDPLKRIHWPLTARRGFPVVREYLPAVQNEIVMFLDVSRQLRFSGARIGNFESSVRLVASLTARAVRAGYRVQLRCGSTGSFDVPPANGRLQYTRVVETLLRVRTRADDAFTDTLRRRMESMPWSSTVIIALHPYLLGNPGFAGAVARLVQHGCRVVCVVYGLRSEAHTTDTPARHARYLAALARSGAELWSDTGAPLGRRAAVRAA